MTKGLAWFAQLDALNPLNSNQSGQGNTGLVLKDLLVIVTTGLALGLVLLLWARHYVKSRQHHHHHHDRKSASPSALAPAEQDSGEEHHHHRRRRRKRRREHRPRNPTLSETGGLPATKPEPSSTPPL
jgi:hypothetical protein